MDFCIHSVISQEVIHFANILCFFSIKFSFDWAYFRAGKHSGCSSIYVEKIVKTICGRIWSFWGEGVYGDKNYYKLFCKKWGFKYFSYNNFLLKKKRNIFSKITAKKTFGRHMDHFSGNGVSGDKSEYNLFYEKWGSKYGFEIFSSKNSIQAGWKPKNQFWGPDFSENYQKLFVPFFQFM